MILYLVQSDKIKALTKNSMGNTEMDILDENSRDKITERIIVRMLQTLSSRSILHKWIPHFNDATMVVAVLIATMAFQAAISPPGGVWQEDTSTHIAGKSVMASTHPKTYKDFLSANGLAFISSLGTIFIISTGLTTTYFLLLIFTISVMLMSMGSIAVSYGLSMSMTQPVELLSFGDLVRSALFLIFGFLAIIIVSTYMKCVIMRAIKEQRHRMDLTTLHQDAMNRGSRESIMSEFRYIVSQNNNFS